MGISRKEFIKRTSAGIAGVTMFSSFSKAAGDFLSREKVKYRVLGRTGIKVSQVGMGATRTSEPSVIMAALDKGINFFDTGRVYANGQNEVMLGKVFAKNRKKLVIQSKVKINENASTGDEIRKGMEDSLHQSLKALQTDYIDVYLLHGVSKPEEINNEDIMRFMEDAKKSGKIRAMGFSSHTNFIELININNESLFYDVIMAPFNYKGSYVHSISKTYREWDQEGLIVQLKNMKVNNLGFVGMKTTSAGPYSATGKEGTYSEALRWILEHDFVCTVVPGMGNIDEINENVTAMW